MNECSTNILLSTPAKHKLSDQKMIVSNAFSLFRDDVIVMIVMIIDGLTAVSCPKADHALRYLLDQSKLNDVPPRCAVLFPRLCYCMELISREKPYFIDLIECEA